MGLDTPLLYGGRMSGAVQRPGRLIEQLLAANPALEQAIEAWRRVRLGVTAWGLYVNGPALRALPAPMVGLADEDRPWMCGFEPADPGHGRAGCGHGLPRLGSAGRSGR